MEETTIYGYIRVLAKEQGEARREVERQREAMRRFPVPEERIFVEGENKAFDAEQEKIFVNGEDKAFVAERDEAFGDGQRKTKYGGQAYQELLGKLRKKDVLVIATMNALGNDYEEILEQWRTLTKEKQVDVVVLDMPLVDTRCENGTAKGDYVVELMQQMLSYVSKKERENV